MDLVKDDEKEWLTRANQYKTERTAPVHAVNVHCKFVIVVDSRSPSVDDDDDDGPMFGINRAGIEAWDSSRVSGREKKGAKAWKLARRGRSRDRGRVEGKKAGNTLGSPRQIYAGPGWLVGSPAPRIHSSLSAARARG